MPRKTGAASPPQRTPDPDAGEHVDGQSTQGGGTGLVRVTINLTPRSIEALERLARATSQSKTDTINRALQVYAVVNEIMERNGGSLYVRHLDGEHERIRLV